MGDGAEGFEDYWFLPSGWQDSAGKGIVREGEVHPRMTSSLQLSVPCLTWLGLPLVLYVFHSALCFALGAKPWACGCGLCTLNRIAGSRDTDSSGLNSALYTPIDWNPPTCR